MTEDRSPQETYEHVLNVVEYNTGGPQACGIRYATLMTIAASHGPDKPEDVRTAVRAALHNDDLLFWHDEQGRKRFTRADDEQAIRQVIERQAERADPDRNAIGQANKLLGVFG